jgi:glycogen(starch) synthase
VRVLMLSWEYPPLDTGGPATHAATLARELVGLGHEVHVVARWHGETLAPPPTTDDGVHVVRVAEAPPVIPMTDRVPAALSFNSRAQAAATRLQRQVGFDVVHVHDRLAAYAAAGLREAYGLPLVVTMHTTELGVHPGLPDEVSRLVHQVEWWLTYEARRVLTCTEHVREQLLEHVQLPATKVEVVPAPAVPVEVDDLAARRRRFAGPRTRLVGVQGRLDGAGLDALLAALRPVREAVGPVRLVVSVAGLDDAEIRRRARRAGVRHLVTVAGADDGRALAALADVTVVLDDPDRCGGTVVRSLAAGTPAVVGPTPATAEVVGDAGVVVPRVTPAALRTALTRVLGRRGPAWTSTAQRRAAARHDPATVAEATVAAYRRAVAEERDLDGAPPLRPVLRAAPLLGLDGTA